MVIKSLPFLVAALLFLVLGCQESSRGLAARWRDDCTGSKYEQYFGSAFEAVPQEMELPLFADLLSATKEPSLSCGGPKREVYRLTYASPNGTLKVIRAEKSAAGRSEVSIGLLDLASRRVISHSTRELPVVTFDDLSHSIRNFQFWSRPSYSSATMDPNVVLLHSGSWIFEGRDDNWYHAIARGPTPRERAFNLVGQRMFSLADGDMPNEFKAPQY